MGIWRTMCLVWLPRLECVKFFVVNVRVSLTSVGVP